MSDASNGPGWWQGADGKWFPPEEPKATSMSASQMGSSQTPSGSTAKANSFKFDMSRWTQPERVTAIATLVLFVSLYLPWYTYNYGLGSVSVDGLWHGWMYLVFLLSLAVLVYLVARAGFKEMPFKLPMAEEQFLLMATGVNFVLTLIAFFLKPGGIGFSGIGWGFGAFVGLAASFVAAAPLGIPAIKARNH